MLHDSNNLMYVTKRYEESIKKNAQAIFSSDKINTNLTGFNDALDSELVKINNLLNTIVDKSDEIDSYRKDVHSIILNKNINAKDMIDDEIENTKSHSFISNIKDDRTDSPFKTLNFINKDFTYNYENVNLNGKALTNEDLVKSFKIQLTDDEKIKVIEFAFTYKQHPNLIHFDNGVKTIESTVEVARVFSGRFFIIRPDPIAHPEQILVKAIIKNSDNNGSVLNEEIIDIKSMKEIRNVLFKDSVGPEFDIFFMVKSRTELTISIGNLSPYRWLIEKTYLTETDYNSAIIHLICGNISNKQFSKIIYSKSMNEYFIIDDINQKFYHTSNENFSDDSLIEMNIPYSTGIKITEVNNCVFIYSDSMNACVGLYNINSFIDTGKIISDVSVVSTGEIIVQENNTKILTYNYENNIYSDLEKFHTLSASENGLKGSFIEISNGTILMVYTTSNTIYYKFKYSDSITGNYAQSTNVSAENSIDVTDVESINPINSDLELLNTFECLYLKCNYYNNNTKISKLFALNDLDTSSIFMYKYNSVTIIKEYDKLTQTTSDNNIIIKKMVNTPLMTFAIDVNSELYILDDQHIIKAVNFSPILKTTDTGTELIGYSDKDSILKLDTSWSNDENFLIDNPYLDKIVGIYETPLGVYIADENNVYSLNNDNILINKTFLENREIKSVSNIDFNHNKIIIIAKDLSDSSYELYEHDTNIIESSNENLRYKYLDLFNGTYNKYDDIDENWTDVNESVKGPIVEFSAKLYTSFVDRTGAIYSAYNNETDKIVYESELFSTINPNEQHDFYFSKLNTIINKDGITEIDNVGFEILKHPNVVIQRIKANKQGFIKYDGFKSSECPTAISSSNNDQQLVIVRKDGDEKLELNIVRNEILKIMKAFSNSVINDSYNFKRIYTHDFLQTPVNEYEIESDLDFVNSDDKLISIDFWADRLFMNTYIGGSDKKGKIKGIGNDSELITLQNTGKIKTVSVKLGNFIIAPETGIYKITTSQVQETGSTLYMQNYACEGFNSLFNVNTHGRILNIFCMEDAYQHIIVTCAKGSFIYRCRDSDTSAISSPLSDVSKFYWLNRTYETNNTEISGYLNEVIKANNEFYFVTAAINDLNDYETISDTYSENEQKFGGMYKLNITKTGNIFSYNLIKCISPINNFVAPNFENDICGKFREISYYVGGNIFITLDSILRYEHKNALSITNKTVLVKYNIQTKDLLYLTDLSFDNKYDNCDISLVKNYESCKSKIIITNEGNIYCGGPTPLFKYENETWNIVNSDFTGKLYYYHNRIYSISHRDGDVRWYDEKRNEWISIYKINPMRNNLICLTETPFDVYVITDKTGYRLVDNDYSINSINISDDKTNIKTRFVDNEDEYIIRNDTNLKGIHIDLNDEEKINLSVTALPDLSTFKLVKDLTVQPDLTKEYCYIKYPLLSPINGLESFQISINYFEKNVSEEYTRLESDAIYDPTVIYYKATNVIGKYKETKITDFTNSFDNNGNSILYVKRIKWFITSDITPSVNKTYYILQVTGVEYTDVTFVENESFDEYKLYFIKSEYEPDILPTNTDDINCDVYFDKTCKSLITCIKNYDRAYVYKNDNGIFSFYKSPVPIYKVWNMSIGNVCLYRKGFDEDGIKPLYGLAIFDNDYKRIVNDLLNVGVNFLNYENNLILKEVGSKIMMSVYNDFADSTFKYNTQTKLFELNGNNTYIDFIDYYDTLYASRRNTVGLIIDKFINESDKWTDVPVIDTTVRDFTFSRFMKIVDESNKERLYVVGVGDSNLYKLDGSSFIPICKMYNKYNSAFGNCINLNEKMILISGKDISENDPSGSRNVLYSLNTNDEIIEYRQNLNEFETYIPDYFDLVLDQDVVTLDNDFSFISLGKIVHINIDNHLHYNDSNERNIETNKMVSIENNGNDNILPITSIDNENLIFQTGFGNLSDLRSTRNNYFMAFDKNDKTVIHQHAVFDSLVDTKYGLFGLINEEIYLNEYSEDFNSFQGCGTGTVGKDIYRKILNTSYGVFYIDEKTVYKYNETTELFDIKIDNTITKNGNINYAQEFNNGIFIGSVNRRLFNEPLLTFGLNIYDFRSNSFTDIIDLSTDTDLKARYITNISETSRGIFIVTNNKPSTNSPTMINQTVTSESKNRIFRLWTVDSQTTMYEECNYEMTHVNDDKSVTTIYPSDLTQIIEIDGEIYLTRSSTYRCTDAPETKGNEKINWEGYRWIYTQYEEIVVNESTGKCTTDKSYRFELVENDTDKISNKNLIGDGSGTWYDTKFGTFIVRDYHSLQYVRSGSDATGIPPFMSNKNGGTTIYNSLTFKIYPTHPVLFRDTDGNITVVSSIDDTGRKLVKLVETDDNLFAITLDLSDNKIYSTIMVYDNETNVFKDIMCQAYDYEAIPEFTWGKAWETGYYWDLLDGISIKEFDGVIFFKGLNNILYRIGNWKILYKTIDDELTDTSGEVLYELKMVIDNKELFNNLIEKTDYSYIDKFVIKEIGIINVDNLSYENDESNTLVPKSLSMNKVTQYFLPHNFYNCGTGEMVNNTKITSDIKEYTVPVKNMKKMIRDHVYEFKKNTLINNRFLKKDQNVLTDGMKHETTELLGDIENYINNLDNYKIELKIYPTNSKKNVKRPKIESFWY